MLLRCPACSKSNPADAFYCHFDGRPLSKEHQGPLHVGSLPFPTKFHFADGQTCVNFNQLALACDKRWEEARALLVDGTWPTFFRSIGRLDLAAAAQQAAGEPDPDLALSLLLEKLPADHDSLRAPKLAVESTEENLGTLFPGADLSFEIVIFNHGMLLLRGVVSSDCDWLVFGERAAPIRTESDRNDAFASDCLLFGEWAGPTQKMFQTRTACAVAVRVLGSKLRAGLKPLQGETVIDSNGGTITVPVRAEVPIRPFPAGLYANEVLAGVRSPREVARKAKEFPKEAAVLFEQSAVKEWYALNGWTYPIEGSEGSGKGAVQQFFEALGLTTPPRLEIKPDAVTFNGKVGDRLSRRLTLSTEEAKPVYAQAWSNQDWVKFGPIKYLGNKVKIPVEITVPPQPGETVHAQVVIQGNGKQQFVVPVSVTVEKKTTTVAKKPTTGLGGKTDLIALPAAPPSIQGPPGSGWQRLVGWLSRWWTRTG